MAFALRRNRSDPRRPGTDVAQEADAARKGKAGAGGKGRAVAPGGDGNGPSATKNAAGSDGTGSGDGGKRVRLPQGVAVEIGASADLAITVDEEGDGHAVDERDVNGDGT